MAFAKPWPESPMPWGRVGGRRRGEGGRMGGKERGRGGEGERKRGRKKGMVVA